MKLNELLKTRRTSLGLTLQDVGDAAGLGKGYVHDLENGKTLNPGIQTCVRLSIALGITINQIAAAAVSEGL